jgi:hypothetical protein
VITASVTASPSHASAVSRMRASTIADTSGGEYVRPRAMTWASPLSAATISYGQVASWRATSASSNLRPMSRFTA